MPVLPVTEVKGEEGRGERSSIVMMRRRRRRRRMKKMRVLG
jgi:hypothetical protein